MEMLYQGGRVTLEGPQGSATVERAEESEPPTIDVMPVSDRERPHPPK